MDDSDDGWTGAQDPTSKSEKEWRGANITKVKTSDDVVPESIEGREAFRMS